MRLPFTAFAIVCALLLAPLARAATYDIQYEVEVDPERGVALVDIQLAGKQLPSRLRLHIDPERHRAFDSRDPFTVKSGEVTWRPEGKRAHLRYEFVVDGKRSNGRYDSMMTPDWAILRSDKLVPPISVTAKKGLTSRARLDFDLPDGWSAAAPYESDVKGTNRFHLTDPGRSLVRPKGWLILGDFTSRQDMIDGSEVRIAAPSGQDARLQDTLAFVSWTLPALQQVFPDFPQRLLIVMARDPMWRGGLSGTRSLFMHADRPLISGNRTSSMIHELVHVGTGIHGDAESDWIVEGIAEYYAAEILRRTGGISDTRYRQTLADLEAWGKKAPSLLVKRSSGPTTARAVGVMTELDAAIRRASKGRASLDNVATALASQRGEITLAKFTELVDAAAGRELGLLERSRLGSPP
ncbi:hypothetical protein [Haliea sp. E17]|uniref:hypothetical protein n=1 Tax=Haliea sp. E17 TaxID=3401576 RepID=UPI003AACA114